MNGVSKPSEHSIVEHCRMKERSEWCKRMNIAKDRVSEPVNRVSEPSEHSKAERCRVSEWSERCERTNIASDRVAC